MSTNEIALRDPNVAGEIDFRPVGLPSDDVINRLFRIAKGLAASGIYKDARQAEQAFAKLLIGHELGLGVAQSMQGLQFVEGQIQVHYSTLAYFIKSRGFDYRFPRLDDEGVEIQFLGRDGEPLDMPTSTYTMDDAKKAGKGEKDTYKRHPRNMLIARAMSNGVKWFLPQAMAGVPVYVEGEIIPDAELSEGEGTGEPAGIELPSSVEKIIARAESLGHDGWAYRPAWELKVGRIGFDVEAEVAKAIEELDAFKEKASQDPEGSDVPIDLEGLPEPSAPVSEPTVDEQMAEAPSGMSSAEHASVAEAAVKAVEESKESPGGEKRVQEGPTGEEDMPPVIQETPRAARRRSVAGAEKPGGSDDIEVLRARRRLYEELSADTEDEEAEKAAYLDALDRQIAALGQKEADENPEQQTLI